MATNLNKYISKEIQGSIAVGTVVGTYVVGEVITGGTSLATARIVKITGADETTVIEFDSIGGDAPFADGEAITGGTSAATSVVDTVAGNLPAGSLGGTTAATASDVIATSAGIVKNQVVGSRLRQEVLVASRNFAVKQAV